MFEQNNDGLAKRLLESLYGPAKPLKIVEPLTVKTEVLPTDEAAAVLEMCPEVTVAEMKQFAVRNKYSMDGKAMYDHIYVPNPLAGLVQGFLLSEQRAYHDLVDQNQGIITELQGKVQVGIIRGKNNCYYLRPTDSVVRSRFAGGPHKYYEFYGKQASSDFQQYNDKKRPVLRDLGVLPRALSIWNKLGFPKQRDWRGEIFYFHKNPDAKTMDFGMFLPQNEHENLQKTAIDEVQRQLALYNEANGETFDIRSLKAVAAQKTGDYGRLLAQVNGFDVLHIISSGLDRANPDKMTIVMEALSNTERAWLKNLVEHNDIAYPDLTAASLLYYGIPLKPLPWLPPGIKAINPRDNTDTHLNQIHVYFPSAIAQNVQGHLFSGRDDVFTTLGRLDRGRFWEGTAGFASEIYDNFGKYLRKLGIYDEVSKRSVNPVLEAIRLSLVE